MIIYSDKCLNKIYFQIFYLLDIYLLFIMRYNVFNDFEFQVKMLENRMLLECLFIIVCFLKRKCKKQKIENYWLLWIYE